MTQSWLLPALKCMDKPFMTFWSTTHNRAAVKTTWLIACIHIENILPWIFLFFKVEVNSLCKIFKLDSGHLYAHKSSKPRVYSILCGTNQRWTKATSVSCSSKLERLDGEGEMLLLAVQRVRRRWELESRGGSLFLPVLLCINRWSSVFLKKRVYHKSFMF